MKQQDEMQTLLQLRLCLCLLLACQNVWGSTCVSEGRLCFTPIPNLEAAMEGYDPVMSNPLQTPDPGIRSQLFEPIGQHDDGSFVLNSFVEKAHEFLACDSELSMKSLRSYNEYKREKSSSHSFSVEADVSASVGISGFSFEASAGYGREEMGDESNIRKFYHETDGEIIISKARCLTHTVAIAKFRKPSFTIGFLEALRRLHFAAKNPKAANSERAFKEFVASYGTHFMRTLYLGSSIRYEKRFISNTEDSSSESSRARCIENSAYASMGAGVEGLGSASSSFSTASGNCEDSSENNAYFKKNSMSSSKIVSVGSLPISNLDHWASTVKDSPLPIHYELDKISNLFTKQWFDTIPISDEGQHTEMMNGTAMHDFFESKSASYCEIMLGKKCSTTENKCDLKNPCGPGIKCIDDAGSYPGYRCDVKYGGVIIAGGFDGKGDRLADVEGFDTWQLPSLPQPIVLLALSTVGSRIYCCGGTLNNEVDVDYCYILDRSASSPSWIQSTSLPRSIRYPRNAVVGSHIWYTYQNQLFDLNTVTTQFRTYNLPFIIGDQHCPVSNATHSYIIDAGGNANEIWVNTVASSPKRWSKVAVMAGGRKHHACLWLNEIVYVTGGETQRRDVEVFNTNTRTVQETGPLNHGRHAHQMMVYNGEPAVVGGFGRSGVLDIIETYDLENRQWKLSSRKLQTSRDWFGLVQLHD